MRLVRHTLPAILVIVTVLAGTVACGAADEQPAGLRVDDTPAVVGPELLAVLDELGLTSLASAVEEVDLGLDELAVGTGYTFLAPNDDAFLALTADQLTDLLADPIRLRATLRNHVLAGSMDADTLADRDEVEAASGSTYEVGVDGDHLVIGPARVVSADHAAGEGTVHVVDLLLLDE